MMAGIVTKEEKLWKTKHPNKN